MPWVGQKRILDFVGASVVEDSGGEDNFDGGGCLSVGGKVEEVFLEVC